MSYVKCNKCMKDYSSFLKACPYCNKNEVFGAAISNSDFNKRKMLEERLLIICDNYFEKNNDEFSNETINNAKKIIDDYINKLEYIYNEDSINKMIIDYNEYLNSLTYDYYRTKHFKTRELKNGKYVVGFNNIERIGENTEIIFPDDTIGIKGKKERYYSPDLDKYCYCYPPILKDIKCKLLLFPDNYKLIDGVFENITVLVATKDNLDVDVNSYEVSLATHKVCPETPFFLLNFIELVI